ncbi:MAG: PBP1A family penicillin-binding protein [Patescibacteria group bacterium]|jgi:1A family penicillin-binding protein
MPIPQLRHRRQATWKNHPTNKKVSKNKKWLIKKLIKIAFFFIAAIILFSFLSVLLISRNLPNPNQLINREVAQSTKIYDRTGENILYEISGDQRRTLVQLKDLPNYVKQATIAIEDKNFYNHGGFSLWAMFRTAITNVIYGRSAGGSTLTQQFIKNAVLSPEKTITRKVKELVLAYQLEKKFSKDEILQMYLNEIPYGSNAYGVEAASQKYFGKNAKDLTLAEAAVLAALTQSPSRYSPYGANKDLLLGRKDYILNLMAEQGYISTAERDGAKAQTIVFKGRDNNMTAPHFVMYVKDILAEKYGEKMIEQEGLKIYTTLDLYKQKIAEEIITEKTKNYPKTYSANNAALISLDPKTGQILAMVGSRDYFNDEIDGQVNVTTRPRQPGSSMKPIVYSALFEKGYTPNTILYDVVTNFSTDSAQSYEPHNYDGKEYGPVKIRQALAGSLNIPAVKAIYLAGINNVIDLAENMGYTTLYPRNRFGLSLVLGGGEVKLLEHTNAYSAFARDGKISPIVSILKVEDKNGRIIEEYQPAEKKVLDSKVARMINSILSDNEARTFVFGSKNYLTLGNRPVAAKTGTTNDFHDAWAIGYTPSLVTGVWVGNSDNQAMKGKADGSVLAAPIWHDYMLKVLGNTPLETFKAPDDYKTGKPILDGEIPTQIIKIDNSTGLLATSSTPSELISDKIIPNYHCILYYVDRNDPLGSIPKNPSSDPQFNLWEIAVQKWANKNASSSTSTLPINYNEFHKPENAPIIKIISPLKNQTLSSPTIDIQVEATAPRGVNRVEYYLNNNLWITNLGAPTKFTKEVNFLNNGYQALLVKACDDVDNCTTETINFNILIKNNPISAGKNSLKVLTPYSGLALTSIDFPTAVNLQIAKPERVARLNLFIKDSLSGKTELIKNLTNLTTSNITTAWDVAPTAGSYSLYAILYDWNGDTIKSNEVKLTIGQ